jgi:hypothetical protein
MMRLEWTIDEKTYANLVCFELDGLLVQRSGVYGLDFGRFDLSAPRIVPTTVLDALRTFPGFRQVIDGGSLTVTPLTDEETRAREVSAATHCRMSSAIRGDETYWSRYPRADRSAA